MAICIEFTKIYENFLIKKFYFRAFSLTVLSNILIFNRDVQSLISFLNYRIIKKRKLRHFLSNSTPSSYLQVGKHGNICTLNEIDIGKEGD